MKLKCILLLVAVAITATSQVSAQLSFPINEQIECKEILGNASYYPETGYPYEYTGSTPYVPDNWEDFKNYVDNGYQLGKVIYLDPNNTYTFTGTADQIVISTPNVVIYGDNTVIDASSSTSASSIIRIESNNIRITDLTFLGSECGHVYTNLVKALEIMDISDHVEVDDCLFKCFSYYGIGVGIPGSKTDCLPDELPKSNHFIHHCRFEQNQGKIKVTQVSGFGYGVMVSNAYARIFKSSFKENRHDIAGVGYSNTGYELACNEFEGHGMSHNVDAHAGPGKCSDVSNTSNCPKCEDDNGNHNPNKCISSLGPFVGRFFHVHNNHFAINDQNPNNTGQHESIKVRGRPEVQYRIENNIFDYANITYDPRTTTPTHSKYCIVQRPSFNCGGKLNSTYDGYGNMVVMNNIFGEEEYLGVYLREIWSRSNASNFMVLPSTNDIFYSNDNSNSNDIDMFFANVVGQDNSSPEIIRKYGNAMQWIEYDASYDDNWSTLVTTGYSINNLSFGYVDNKSTYPESGDHTDMIYMSGSDWWVSYDIFYTWFSAATSVYQKPDVLLGYFGGPASGPDDLDVLLPHSTWQMSYDFTTWVPISTSNATPINELAVGDFDGDGFSDVFQRSIIDWRYRSKALGTWIQLPGTTSAPLSAIPMSDLKFADFDTDNTTDVIFQLGPLNYVYDTGGNHQDLTIGTFPLNTFGYGDIYGP